MIQAVVLFGWALGAVLTYPRIVKRLLRGDAKNYPLTFRNDPTELIIGESIFGALFAVVWPAWLILVRSDGTWRSGKPGGPRWTHDFVRQVQEGR